MVKTINTKAIVIDFVRKFKVQTTDFLGFIFVKTTPNYNKRQQNYELIQQTPCFLHACMHEMIQ